VCVRVSTVADFSAEDKASGVKFYFARWFVGVQGRESPILWKSAFPEAQNHILQLTSISGGHSTIRHLWTRMVAVTALLHLITALPVTRKQKRSRPPRWSKIGAKVTHLHHV